MLERRDPAYWYPSKWANSARPNQRVDRRRQTAPALTRSLAVLVQECEGRGVVGCRGVLDNTMSDAERRRFTATTHRSEIDDAHDQDRLATRAAAVKHDEAAKVVTLGVEVVAERDEGVDGVLVEGNDHAAGLAKYTHEVVASSAQHRTNLGMFAAAVSVHHTWSPRSAPCSHST